MFKSFVEMQATEDLDLQDVMENLDDIAEGSDVDSDELDAMLHDELNSNVSLRAVEIANENLEKQLRKLDSFNLLDDDNKKAEETGTITLEEHERIRAKDLQTIEALKKVMSDGVFDSCTGGYCVS